MSAVGIDLGTTISLLALAHDDGRVSVLPTRDGGPRLRSVVHVAPDGALTLGEAAQRLAPLEPDAVFAFFKRSMGTAWTVAAGGRRWAPEDLSAAVLEALLEDGAPQLGGRPSGAVVTIPAYFGEDARLATLRAGEAAGVEVLSLLHEPTAACLACRSLVGESGTILVYDLGGGTFDVSVVRFKNDGAEVLATAGDHRLGGKDWDDLIVDLVAERLEGEMGEDPREDSCLLAELQERAREAKHALSRMPNTAVTLHAGGRVHRVEFDRASFWSRGQALFERTEGLVGRVLEDIGGASRLDGALLVGGSTRMPPCAEVVARATGHAPLAGVNPDEAVAAGAALFARGLAPMPGGGDGRGAADGRAGAGGRGSGGGRAGAIRRQIKDVTAHALGFVVVAADGSRYVNEVMIARNAPLPAVASKQHLLELPRGSGQGVLAVHMLQGEAERPLDTDALGCWRFTGIPGKARSAVKIEVSYRYDEDGVVEVSATVDGVPLAPPSIDRQDRDLRWTEEDPSAQPSDPGIVVALVVDVSGSMQGAKLQEAKDACQGFVDELEVAGAGERIAVVSFGSSATRVVDVGEDPAAARRAIKALGVAGSTNMAEGLQVAGGALASEDARRVVVLLTDGAPDDRRATMTVRDRLVGEGVELIARGVAGADMAFLAQLSTGDGELVGAGELAGNFRGIARQLIRERALGRRGGMRWKS